MTDNDPPAPRRKALGRRRRANVAGGRSHRHEVKVTAEEEARLLLRASEQSITVPRLMIEAALAAPGEIGITATERRAVLTRVFDMQRTLGGIAVNINQLAHLGNVHQDVPAGTRDAVEAARVAIEQLNGLLEEYRAA